MCKPHVPKKLPKINLKMLWGPTHVTGTSTLLPRLCRAHGTPVITQVEHACQYLLTSYCVCLYGNDINNSFFQ